MTHDQKVASFKQLLRERGYWRSNAIPPAYQLLWLLGFKTPPPYFLHFWTGVAVAGIPYGFFMGVFTGSSGCFIWRNLMGTLTAECLVPAAITSICVGTSSGLFFGMLMAMFWRKQAQKLQLPDWDNFPSPR